MLAAPPVIAELLWVVADAAGEGEELSGPDAAVVPVETIGAASTAVADAAASVALAVAETVPLLEVAVTCVALVAVAFTALGVVVAVFVTAVGGTVDVAVTDAGGSGVIVTAWRVAVGAAVAGGGKGVSVGSFGSLVGGIDVLTGGGVLFGLGVRVGTVVSAVRSCAQADGPTRFAPRMKANMITNPKIIQRRMRFLLLTDS